MWERLRRFEALDPAARSALLRALVVLPLVSFSLRVQGLRRTQMLLRRVSMPVPARVLSPAAMAEQAARTARMLRAAACYGCGTPTCLAKSVAMCWLLEREGVAARLRIGARKSLGKFQAHAWVELNGAARSEIGAESHFLAFDCEFAGHPLGSA